MFRTLNKQKNAQLMYFILKVLKEKYACANEIKQKLESAHFNYQGKDFFPVLSHLIINKYLCYNWINKTGNPVKYYHLTLNGNEYYKNIAMN